MLRFTVCFLITGLLFVVNSMFGPQSAGLKRLTNTSDHAINLNPALSDDGKVVVFESSADLAGIGENSFHTFRADLAAEDQHFSAVGSTRAICPALSSDGRIIVFASTEDLLGQNPDRNSEVLLFDGSKLRQLTQSGPASNLSRLNDGSFQPSVTADGRIVAFSSNRDFSGQNSDLSYEIFLYDLMDQKFTQLTNDTNERTAASPKISADGSRVYYKRTSEGEPDTADLVQIETETRTARVVAADVVQLSLTEGRAISSDGMRVVYSALTGPNQTQIFVFDGRDNSIRQLTQLGSRSVDVKVQPTISGDGKRVAFATRRRVISTSDGGVELYLLDLPTGQVQQVTNAPSSATAEVVSSLNFDGSLVAFSFPRILSGPVSDGDFRNNSEIYLAAIAPRPIGAATVLNAAALGHEPEPTRIAPDSIATVRGNALALKTETAAFVGGELPFTLAGTTVTVNGRQARIFYVAASEVIFVVPDGLPDGPAEFRVTNGDGVSSKAQANISAAAPGVFTAVGDGRGEAIILNSDTLMTGPFDPSNGTLRLSVFATGASHASNVSVTINGRPALVETVAPADLAGLDEIHVLIPAELRGAGASTLTITADGVQGNPVSVMIGGAAPAPSPTPTPTATPTPTPTPTATPTPTPTPTPNATPTPAPSPLPSPSPSPTPIPGSSPRVVITQIFGGGGNAGAPFRNDFIEIFNAGNTTVDLTGWSVQYASGTATSWSVTALAPVILSPGQYYLVQESSAGSNGVPLPAPDVTGTIAMAAGSGKVALFRSTTALTGACPSDPNIVDFVGYGNTANCFRGSAPAVAASNTNALRRTGNGCTDTRNNSADFILGSPLPRNSKSPVVVCEGLASSHQAVERIFKIFKIDKILLREAMNHLLLRFENT
jgi:uncharacterized protein (TIGR03437 family)